VRIAKTGEPHSVGGNLLLASIKDVKTIFSNKLQNYIDLIPLSKDTVGRRINDMAGNVESQLIERVKKSAHYALRLQIKETTDVTNDANLMCYLRYAHNSNVHEDILFCRTLPIRTTGEEIFYTLDSYISDKEILWEKCVGFCSDGVRAFTGRNSGFVSKIKEVAPDMNWVHCFIRREAFAFKGMPPEFKTVLDSAVKLLNFIKA
jgi:hypothetical protein